MVFCNRWTCRGAISPQSVTILILIDGFLQYKEDKEIKKYDLVTILILIDGFLQLKVETIDYIDGRGHNPYFNRWFSAILCILSEEERITESQSLF